MLLEKESPIVAMKPETAAPSAALLQLLFGKHITYSLSAVARLGVANHISGNPVPVDELAVRPEHTHHHSTE